MTAGVYGAPFGQERGWHWARWGSSGAMVILFSSWVVPIFTQDVDVRPQITGLLPLVLTVVVTDALQAVLGFGLKRTVPSFVSTLVCAALWTALALANLLQAVSKAYSFHRHPRIRTNRQVREAPALRQQSTSATTNAHGRRQDVGTAAPPALRPDDRTTHRAGQGQAHPPVT